MSAHRAATSWHEDAMFLRSRSIATGALVISPPNGSNDMQSRASGSVWDELSCRAQWIRAATYFLRSSMFLRASGVLAIKRTQPPENSCPSFPSSTMGASSRTLTRTVEILTVLSCGPGRKRYFRDAVVANVCLNAAIAAWHRLASSRLYPSSRSSLAARRASMSSKYERSPVFVDRNLPIAGSA